MISECDRVNKIKKVIDSCTNGPTLFTSLDWIKDLEKRKILSKYDGDYLFRYADNKALSLLNKEGGYETQRVIRMSFGEIVTI